jgi:hypothetical protein
MKENIELTKWIGIGIVIILMNGCTPYIQTCHNETIIINNTVIKEVPSICPSCPECKPTEKIVYQTDTSCQERQGEIVREYSDCLKNVTECNNELSSFEDTDCGTQLSKCNETLIDYTNRLNNISYEVDYYANKNR